MFRKYWPELVFPKDQARVRSTGVAVPIKFHQEHSPTYSDTKQFEQFVSSSSFCRMIRF